MYRKRQTKGFSQMKRGSGQAAKAKKDIAELMKYMGVDEYTLGSQNKEIHVDVEKERA